MQSKASLSAVLPLHKIKRPVHLFVALGFTSMVAQVLLMRELVVVFYGNELSLGIMLGSWLLWVGVGSFIAGWLLPRAALFRSLHVAAFIQALLGIFSFATLFGVRLLPALQQETAGEIVGYVPITVSSFLVLGPVCLLLGFLFTLFCHLWGDEDAVISISTVYFFEGLGAAAGGIAFSLVFVNAIDPIETACGILALNLAAAASILFLNRRLWKSITVSIMTVIAAGAISFPIVKELKGRSLEWLWHGLNVVDSRNSKYGNLVYTEDLEQKSLYENSLLIFSYPDQFSAEEAVHFAMLEHPNPKHVLLIGGGANGTVGELLKHSVEQVDYVELDPLIIEMVKSHLPSDVTKALDNPRVKTFNVDGRLFVKETPETYDVIIINLPGPYTAQLNRFYTLEFFRECKLKLSSNGILSFRVKSAENYISPELQQFLGCIHGTLLEVFPDVKVVPGETNIFLACPEPGILTLNADVLAERLSERGLKEKLLSEYYLPFRLSEGRIATLADALSLNVPRRNTDLSPVCFYYDAVLWSKQFKDFSSRLLVRVSKIPGGLILAIIGAVFTIGAVVQITRRSFGSKAILLAVGTTGFAEIAVEIITLLGFQAMHGYVYHEIALIIAGFMLGLALGAMLIRPFASSNRSKVGAFLLIQALVCLYPLLLLGALLLMRAPAGADFFGHLSGLKANIVFPSLAFTAGIVGGMQFPVANALLLTGTVGTARAAGLTYGTDLIGSCLGAFLTTAFLVPVYGIPFSCITASVLNLGALLLVVLGFVSLRLR